MAKSINDAGWSSFLQILKVKAQRAGLATIAVNPSGTTQNCSGCGVKVAKTLSDRWHSCVCGVELDRDVNAAINIRNLAVGHPVNKARKCPTGYWDVCVARSQRFIRRISVWSMSRIDCPEFINF